MENKINSEIIVVGKEGRTEGRFSAKKNDAIFGEDCCFKGNCIAVMTLTRGYDDTSILIFIED